MASLNELFKQLELDSAASRHDDVHEQALEILKSAPHDLRPFRLCVVSLINLDRYLDAHRLFKQYGSQADPEDTLLLERGYVMYKLGLNKELSKLFEEHANVDSTGWNHLKAQFLYREGQYQAALELYQQLIKGNESELDLAVNERAVIADGLASGSIITAAPSVDAEQHSGSYDLLFNESIIALASGDSEKALELLYAAEQTCRQTEPEDENDEVAPILLQKAFVLASLGKADESQQILAQLESENLEDELNVLILSNNVIATAPHTPLLALKELKFPNKINELSPRLSAQQKCALWKNYYRLSTQLGRKSVKTTNSAPTDFTNASLAVFSKAGISANEDIKSQAKKASKYASTVKTVPSALTSAQLNLDSGNLNAAITSLEQLPEQDQLLPGVISALVSLYDSIHSEKKSLALFDKVVSNYTISTSTPPQLEFLTAFLLHYIHRDSTSTKATQLLQEINTTAPSPLIDTALSTTPPPPFESTHDLNELIQEATSRISASTASKTTHHKITKKRARKPRHLPPSFDASKEVDQERWLPMKDRSYYKPKKGKKKKLDTQGGLDKDVEEQLNVRNTGASKSKKKKGKK